MTTIVNTPPGGGSNDSGLGVILVVVIMAIAGAVLFFVYGLPAIRNSNQPSNTTVITVPLPVPTGTTSVGGN